MNQENRAENACRNSFRFAILPAVCKILKVSAPLLFVLDIHRMSSIS